MSYSRWERTGTESGRKPKRIKCACCGRKRLAKFIWWHGGCLEWYCKNMDDCDKHTSGTDARFLHKGK